MYSVSSEYGYGELAGIHLGKWDEYRARLRIRIASLQANFLTLAGSVQSNTVTPSTLTILGLLPNTTYYLRAGAINWNGVANYVAFTSTVTSAGAAPTVSI